MLPTARQAALVMIPLLTLPAAPRAATGQSQGPGALVFHSAAFDSARGMFLVFGGQDAQERPTNALWGWDGSSWHLLARDGPSPRYETVFVYDAQRARTVMHGGRVNGGEFFDTWEWDGTRWHRITANGPALGHPAAAYDPRRGRVVVHGGSRRLDPGPEGQVSSRVTWEYDGRRWVKADTIGPEGRGAHALAFDPVRGEILMSGGAGRRGEPSREDTWSWDGSRWLRLAERGGPPGRNGHSMATAGSSHGVLLFGGSRSEGVVGETWHWADTAWRRIDGAAPPGRVMAGMAWDPSRKRVLMYGGGGETGPLDDLWEFEPATGRWTRVTARAPAGP